ncbi:iron uptake porin [Tumidithrix elongata RA019]|uniref:Iron uptake porin n=1 Tax=Tumidithrix elongata BACA0141 TaxID=2716417 RepID=A0AAW9Q085_9CYAN|nr:iron uptake porin [Tumidithrix elongata RA019]
MNLLLLRATQRNLLSRNTFHRESQYRLIFALICGIYAGGFYTGELFGARKAEAFAEANTEITATTNRVTALPESLPTNAIADPKLANPKLAEQKLPESSKSQVATPSAIVPTDPLLQVKNPAIVDSQTTARSNDLSSNSKIPQSDRNPTLQQINDLSPKPIRKAQVTSVSQLSDVRPTDWAFTALQSLVERYGCIAGYPDLTYRGQRAMTRYEFAAGLNACLDKINEIISAGLADKVSKEDLAAVQKLQEEFAAELATLRGRVDALEAKTTKLESQQFSTTTKLYGQAVFGIQGRTGNTPDLSPRNGVRTLLEADNGKNVTFGYNVQLNLVTQLDFYNRSILLTGLQVGNLDTGSTSSTSLFSNNFTRLGYETNTTGSVVLSDLSYRFMIGDNFVAIVGAEGVNPINVFRGPNRVESIGRGPISAFAQRNPILALGGGRAGIGFDWQLGDRVSLQAVYSASDAASPTPNTLGAGLFGGPYTLGVQLALTPAETVDTTLYYLHSYTNDGNLRTNIGDSLLAIGLSRFTTEAFGATLNWRISPYVTLGTWGGYTTSSAQDPGASGTVETTNWMVYLNFPDLFGRGNLGGIYVGQPPKITSSTLSGFNNVPGSIGLGGVSDASVKGGQPSSTTHVELFYRYRVNDNISITPGIIFLFNNGHSAGSDTVTIGTIRTTFTF